jgi:hypothetical protein
MRRANLLWPARRSVGVGHEGSRRQDVWVHRNCAIWSAEVDEGEKGLLNVQAAITRGRKCTVRAALGRLSAISVFR